MNLWLQLPLSVFLIKISLSPRKRSMLHWHFYIESLGKIQSFALAYIIIVNISSTRNLTHYTYEKKSSSKSIRIYSRSTKAEADYASLSSSFTSRRWNNALHAKRGKSYSLIARQDFWNSRNGSRAHGPSICHVTAFFASNLRVYAATCRLRSRAMR